LADECGVSVRALAHHLKALEADGFITRSTKHLGRGNGSRTAYVLNLEQLKNAPAEIAPANNAPAKSVECSGSWRHVTNRQEPSVSIEAKASIERAPKNSAPSKPEAPEKQNRSSRGTSLPDDWLLPDEWGEDARSIAFKAKQPISDHEISNEADKFRDYWTAKPGAAGRKLDWRGTWRNWFRSYLDRRPKPRNASGNHGTPAFSEHGRSTVADVVLRRRLLRENGNGVPDDAGRGHDVPAASDVIDGEYRRVG
jgi:biotin operon repressor